MITVCHPYDEMELAMLVCVLTREDIPYFIVGQYFGSLVPGVQIPSYNERSIRVPEEYAARALEVINEFRQEDVRNELTFTPGSRVRMVLETILFGWFFPVGSKRPLSKSQQEDQVENESAP